MLSALMLIVASCSKSKEEPQDEQKQVVVKITDSVKIGNLYWSATNFNGEGGVNYNNSSTNNPTTGKLYTLQEAKLLKLPKGWRIPSSDDFAKLCEATVATGGIGNGRTNGYYLLTHENAGKLMSPTGRWKDPSIIGNVNLGFNAVATGIFGDGSFWGNAGSEQPVTHFWTTSNYTGTDGGTAVFIIYQLSDNVNYGATSNYKPTDGRLSLRFVRDI